MLEKKKSFKNYFAKYSTITIQQLFEFFYNTFSEPIHLDELKNKLDEINPLLEQLETFIVVSDNRTIAYPHLTKSFEKITGYSIDEWIKGGIGFFSEQYCQADVKSGEIYLKKILEHQKALSVDKHSFSVYNTTYRFFHKNGYFIWLNNQLIFLFNSADGKSLISLSIVTDISKMKTNDNSIFSIINVDPPFKNMSVEYSETIGATTLAELTETELKILQFIAQDFKNSEIAQKLQLSEYTIKDYRKRMLQKTWCSNTAELVYFALRNKIIS